MENFERDKIDNLNFRIEDLRDPKLESRERGSSDFSFDLTKILGITNSFRDLSNQIKSKQNC